MGLTAEVEALKAQLAASRWDRLEVAHNTMCAALAAFENSKWRAGK